MIILYKNSNIILRKILEKLYYNNTKNQMIFILLLYIYKYNNNLYFNKNKINSFI